MTVPSYVVITPARDEEEHIGRTIECMAQQTLVPTQWVIVNDGSKDRTEAVVREQSETLPWIKLLNRPDRGFRAAGSGVMEAFYAGFDELDFADWDFIVKFDADLTFEPDYFERSLAKFREDTSLGIGGGVIYNRVESGLQLEKHPKFHVRGATKIYRRACWDDIGGLIREPGWDTLDEVKANLMGWKTESFSEPSLVQERFTGDAAGQWSNWVKNGRASFITGYHPVFLTAKAMARAAKRPYLKATVGLMVGFFGAALSRTPQIDDPDLIRYLRKQQLRKLVGLPSIWV